MALLTEELNGYRAAFGASWLKSKSVGADAIAHARSTTSKVFQAVMKQPELGINVKGSTMRCWPSCRRRSILRLSQLAPYCT